MSSDEVNAAVGEAHEVAPEKVKSAVEAWRENRAACSAARERYDVARNAGDAEAMARETGLIDAIEILGRELEREAAAEREQTAKQRATSRLVGITRAYGSVAKQLDDDEKRVVEKIAEVQDAIARLNQRFTKAAELRAEAEALADRFDLPKLNLPILVAPRSREFVKPLSALERGLLGFRTFYRSVEDCAHRLRTRRNYREIEGSEGFVIIEEAGLRPFPELNETQRGIVEGRQLQAERARHSFAQHAGEASHREWGKS